MTTRQRKTMNSFKIGVRIGLLGLAVMIAATAATAQSTQVGTARNAIGTLVVVRPDGVEDRLQGKGSLKLFEQDVLRTAPGSQALIDLREGVLVALNENTSLRILSRWEKTKGTTRILRVKEGEVWVKTTGDGPKAFEVETPVATAALRETEFNIKVHPDGQSVLTVIQGLVEFGTPFGSCPIKAATVSYGVRGKRCTKPEAVDTKSVAAWSRAVQQ
jgi:ferric-dicitrate binding protein FerR (iron transport regulator)